MPPRKNIFLTGAPSSGKTTIIKKIIALLNVPARGFYTEEEKSGEKRVGFMMKTLDGKEAYLAHQDIRSNYKIRRYGVSIHNIETIAVSAIRPAGNGLIILDEIGKMECFSEMFKETAINVLDSLHIVIGTITLGGDDFIQSIKKRDDLDLTEVTFQNRDALPELILSKLYALRD